jgi:hypothetical protein
MTLHTYSLLPPNFKKSIAASERDEIRNLVGGGNIKFMHNAPSSPVEIPAPRHLDFDKRYDMVYILLGESGQPLLKSSYSHRKLIEASKVLYHAQSSTGIRGRDTFILNLFPTN